MGKGLAPHAVLLPCAADFELILAGKLQSTADVVFVRDSYNSVDRGLVQVAGIVGEPTQLFE